VPFSLALADDAADGGGRIVRGAIDCLVRRPDGRVVVVDFKTGAPRAEHEAQLALYVRAVRHLCPTTAVDGLLLYAGTV
jgi:ATP-dependent exoDNAse (exonuclease V) beta subunit